MKQASAVKFATVLMASAAMMATTASAQSGGANKRQIAGQIGNNSPSQDGRRYEVRTMTFEAGKRYAIEAKSDAFDTKLRVSFADDNDETLGEDDDGGEGTNSLLEFVPQRSGTHRVRVSSFTEDTGAYQLTVRNLAPLPALLRPTPTSTSNVQFKHFTGNLSATDGVVRSRRVDDYAFQFQAGKQVMIYLDRIDEGLDPLLEVYTEANRHSSQPLASDDDGGSEVNSFLTFVPEDAGSYIVRATSLGGEDVTGRYRLTVGQQP